jgi:hypothetical protein
MLVIYVDTRCSFFSCTVDNNDEMVTKINKSVITHNNNQITYQYCYKYSRRKVTWIRNTVILFGIRYICALTTSSISYQQHTSWQWQWSSCPNGHGIVHYILTSFWTDYDVSHHKFSSVNVSIITILKILYIVNY